MNDETRLPQVVVGSFVLKYIHTENTLKIGEPMISVNRQFEYGKVFNDARCLSTDEKPTDNIRNGSILTEIDTGKRYAFDADERRWIELPSEGGGGGSYVLPTMSPTTKGGAKVGDGLEMDGDALHVGSLAKESTGEVDGPLASVEAEGWAEQDGTPTPDSPVEIQVVRGHTVTGKTGRYVDFVVKQGDTTLSTTPIPLPSRGWVAGLPDGTADELTVDAAGRWEWVNRTNEVVFDGSENWNNIKAANDYNRYAVFVQGVAVTSSYGLDDMVMSDYFVASSNDSTSQHNNGFHRRSNGSEQLVFYYDNLSLSDWSTWLSTHNVTVLYPLTTSTTESGYIDLPDIPSDATVSIPELEGFSCSFWVDGGSMRTLADAYHDRTLAEAAQVTDAAAESVLGSLAPVEGTTASANHTQGSYIVTQGRLCKVTSAIATDETIAIGTNVTPTDVGAEMYDESAFSKAVSLRESYDLQVLNNTYEGRNIASIPEIATEVASYASVYAFLHARVAAADFSGLRIRDYFDVPVTDYGTIRYQLAGFDTYYNCGNAAMGHHIVCVPSAPIVMPAGSDYTVNESRILWNTTDTNQGTAEETNPYLASNLHKWEIEEYLPALPSALQAILINYLSYVEVRYAEGQSLTASTGGKWADLGKVWSPSEVEVYGRVIHGTPKFTEHLDSHFPLFKETKDRIKGGRVACWLRVASGSSASVVCLVHPNGLASYNTPTDTNIRPFSCFLLG